MGADEEFDVDKGVDINVSHTDVYDEKYPIIHINRRYKTRSDNVNEPTHDTDTSSLSDTKQRSQCSNGNILNDSSQPDTRGRPEDGRNSPRNYKEEYFCSKEPASFCLIPCYEDYLVMFSSASGNFLLILFYYCLLLRKLFSYSVVWWGIVPEPKTAPNEKSFADYIKPLPCYLW
jgi:hypothetical protein